MRIALKSIFIFIFLLIPALSYAATNTYYVTQNGNGSKDGSPNNAWSVSDFNNKANWSKSDNPDRIDPGDTVYFSGTITSRITPPVGYGGSSGNYVTLDGWEGGTCDPVRNDGCSSAAVIDRPSRAKGNFTNYCMSLKDNNYLIIQDFNMQDSRGAIGAVGPTSGSQSTHLTIRRNYMHNMSGHGVQITMSSGNVGYDYVTFGGALGDGNYVYDTVEDAIDILTDSHCVGLAKSNDVVFSYNVIDNSFQDLNDLTNVVSLHTGNRILFEYNTLGNASGQSCLALKERGGDEKIVRFNKFYNCGLNGGINVVTDQGPQTNFYIYANLVYASAGGILLYRNYDEMHIWSNVIHNVEADPGGSGGYSLLAGSGGTPGDVYMYNNTVSRGDMAGARTASSGLHIVGSSAQNVRVKNNLFYYSSGDDTDRQVHVESGDEGNLTELDYNTYYTSGTPYIHYNSASRETSWMVSNSAFCDNNDITHPGFTDPNGANDTHGDIDDDYTLDGTNINNGVSLPGCFDVSIQGKNYHMCYNDALDPNATNWSTTPPTVVTTKQEYHGSWERGAYVYEEISGKPVSADKPVSATAPAPPNVWIVN